MTLWYIHLIIAIYVLSQISTNYVSFQRGQSASLTVTLNLPFGCPIGTLECHLNFELNDPYDSYRCYDTSIAAIHSNTCGGQIQGAASSVVSGSSWTNITLTSVINDRYYMRNNFHMQIRTHAVGNTNAFWEIFATDLNVSVCVKMTESDHVLFYDGWYV